MRYPTALLTVLALATAACEPEEREAFQAEVCLQLDHHGVTPADAMVYASGVADFPGYGADMDARFPRREQMRANGRVCFASLNAGPHWFAAEGWDDVIADSVRGSKFLDITTRADFYEVRMEVSEQH